MKTRNLWYTAAITRIAWFAAGLFQFAILGVVIYLVTQFIQTHKPW